MAARLWLRTDWFSGEFRVTWFDPDVHTALTGAILDEGTAAAYGPSGHPVVPSWGPYVNTVTEETKRAGRARTRRRVGRQ